MLTIDEMIAQMTGGGPALAGSGGIDFAGALSAAEPLLTGGAVTPTNVDFLAFPTLDELIQSISTGGTQTTGGLGAVENALGTVSGGSGALSVPALQQILQTTTGKGGVNLPGVLSSGAQLAASKSLADKYDELARDLADRADPFGSGNVKGMRKLAQNEYATQYSGGPLSWMETTYKPFAERDMDIELRRLSAIHGNPALSPTALAEATRNVTRRGYEAYLDSRGQVAGEAGAGFNPASGANLYGQAANAGLNQVGNLGGAIGSGISYATGGSGSQQLDAALRASLARAKAVINSLT